MMPLQEITSVLELSLMRRTALNALSRLEVGRGGMFGE